MNRKIAAILAADVAGYSRLVAEDEEEALRRLSAYRSVFTECVASTGGRIFNTAGDSVLAEFQSAVNAVRCAVDVQESIRTRNLAYPMSRQMSFRIGITIGDVVEQNGDLLGDGVNLAARLEGVAPPGGVAVSRTVYEAVLNKVSVGFNDMGLQQLKNIPDRVQVYTIDTTGARATEPMGFMGRLKSRVSGYAPVLALVVGLLAGGALYYAFGNPATTTAAKPGVTEAQVASSSASAKTKAEPAAPTATSPDAKSATDVKDGAASSPPADVVPPGAEAQKVATEATEGAVQNDPSPPPQTDAAQQGQTSGPDYFVAKHVLPRAKADCLEGDPHKVGADCRLVIEHGLVAGAELAKAHVRVGLSLREAGDTEQAIAAYTKAIEIAPKAEAYTHRGVAHFDREEWDAATADYTKAIELDARYGEAYNNRAWLQYRLGDYERALKDANQAVRFLPGAAYSWDTRANIHEALGDKVSAISDFRQALTLDPDSADSRKSLERLGEQP